MDGRRELGPPRIIEPVEFRSSHERTRRSFPIGRWIVGALLLGVVGLALAVGWIGLTWQRVEIEITPAPERFGIAGPWPRLEVAGSWLVRPGQYTIRAGAEGYRALEEMVVVGPGADRFELAMVPLPGLVTVVVSSGADGTELTGAEVFLDGALLAATPLRDVEVEPGTYTLRAEHDRHVAAEVEIGVEGFARRERVDLVLGPDWAEVSIGSTPAGAEVRLDGASVGATPCTIEAPSGLRSFEVLVPGFEPWRERLEIVAGRPLSLEGIVLERVRGLLSVETVPPGALVMVGGDYAGTSPLELPVTPDETLVVRAAMDGHRPAESSVSVGSGASMHVRLELEAERVRVALSVVPRDALVSIDGGVPSPIGSGIELTTVEHTLEFTRDGYTPVTRTIRPRPGLSQRVVVELARIPPPREITAANGSLLRRIEGGSFTMGASRSERGRRSNETLRKVVLERPFAMGVREVTNAEYSRFDPGHQSGMAESAPLDSPERPVVRVSWEDAARFCNWLSVQDGLDPAYEEVGGVVRGVRQPTMGYRLPTEAEWAFVARVDAGGTVQTYPWGRGFPPPGRVGNFADKSAAGLVAGWLEGYDDGFPGSAPVASFAPNARGIYDMGGNVAEWCHDLYATYTYNPTKTFVDPMGPEVGQHHVVRGSSWRHFSMSTLRCSYRDYGDEPRDDLGFRVCRYLEAKEVPE